MDIAPERVVREVRCPVHPRLLFAKLTVGDATIGDSNTIEFACRDCREEMGRQRGARPKRVLHTFTLFGDLIETDVSW